MLSLTSQRDKYGRISLICGIYKRQIRRSRVEQWFPEAGGWRKWKMLVKSIKFHLCRMRKFWGSKEQHGDYSYQYCTVSLRFAERVDPKCSQPRYTKTYTARKLQLVNKYVGKTKIEPHNIVLRDSETSLENFFQKLLLVIFEGRNPCRQGCLC